MDKYSESVSATLTAIKYSKIRSKREKLIENLLNMTLNHFDRVARFKLADLSYLDDVLSMMYRKRYCTSILTTACPTVTAGCIPFS